MTMITSGDLCPVILGMEKAGPARLQDITAAETVYSEWCARGCEGAGA